MSALRRRLPDWSVAGADAGLHLLVRLPDSVEEARLVTAAATRGLALLGTAGMFGTLPPVPGLALGYARTPAGLLEEAVVRLPATADDARQQRVPPRTTAARLWPPELGATAIDFFP